MFSVTRSYSFLLKVLDYFCVLETVAAFCVKILTIKESSTGIFYRIDLHSLAIVLTFPFFIIYLILCITSNIASTSMYMHYSVL